MSETVKKLVEGYHAKGHELVTHIDRELNGEVKHENDRTIGFILLAFPYEEDIAGKVLYLSNGCGALEVEQVLLHEVQALQAQRRNLNPVSESTH